MLVTGESLLALNLSLDSLPVLTFLNHAQIHILNSPCILWQAAWYAELSVHANVWQAVARLGELATESNSAAILTDKTGTLTLNRMSTEVVARRLEPTDECHTWALFSERQPIVMPPSMAIIGGRFQGGGGHGAAAGTGDVKAGDAAASCCDANLAVGDVRATPSGSRLVDGVSSRDEVGSKTLELLPPRPFPRHGEELSTQMLDTCVTWAATTGELPGGEVGEAEEASFFERVPGRLLRNVTDGAGGAEVIFTISEPGSDSNSGLMPTQGSRGTHSLGDCLVDIDALQRSEAQDGRHALNRAMKRPPLIEGFPKLDLPEIGAESAHRIRIRLLLPLDLSLRAKGALVEAGRLSASHTRVDANELETLLLALSSPRTPPETPCGRSAAPRTPQGAIRHSGTEDPLGQTSHSADDFASANSTGGVAVRRRANGDGLAIVAQGAGSFFKAMHPPNAGIIDLLEGGSTTGLLLRHFEWRGSVRIWWHGERHVTEEEADALVRDLRLAESSRERKEVRWHYCVTHGVAHI